MARSLAESHVADLLKALPKSAQRMPPRFLARGNPLPPDRPQLPLVNRACWREVADMNRRVIIFPIILALGGVICFLLLPLPFGLRLAVLISELAAATVVGFLLFRRLG